MSIEDDAWGNDCMRWWGYILTGQKAHWCPDWDYLPIDETLNEINACTCKWQDNAPA